MVLGLLLLPAWTVGVTHVAAGALVFLIRRDSWRNIAVNLSFITVETGAAALVVLADHRPGQTPKRRLSTWRSRSACWPAR